MVTRAKASKVDKQVRAFAYYLHDRRRAGSVDRLSADEAQEAAALYDRVRIRSTSPGLSGVDLDELSDADLGRWMRLVAKAERPTPRGRKPHSGETVSGLLARLLGDADDDALERAKGWGERAEVTGSIMGSRLLFDDVDARILDPTDLSVLCWLLWALQDSDEAEVSIERPKAIGFGPVASAFSGAIDQLTVALWIDSRVDGRDRWTIRLGPRSRDAMAQVARWRRHK